MSNNESRRHGNYGKYHNSSEGYESMEEERKVWRDCVGREYKGKGGNVYASQNDNANEGKRSSFVDGYVRKNKGGNH